MPIISAYPEPIQQAIAYLSHLPGIGSRSAERMVLSMMTWKPEEREGLGSAIAALASKVTLCPICGNYSFAMIEFSILPISSQSISAFWILSVDRYPNRSQINNCVSSSYLDPRAINKNRA